MELETLRTIIEEELNYYWKSYETIERSILEKLKTAESIRCKKVVCTGEIHNFYIILVFDNQIVVYNQANDLENCYILKNYSRFNELAFNDEFLVLPIEDEILSLIDLPTVLLVNLCVVENFPIPRLNLSTGAIASFIRKNHYADVRILDMQTRITKEKIVETSRLLNPAFIGLSISFGQRVIAEYLLDELFKLIERGELDSKIVVGNLIPSLYCNEFLNKYKDVIVAYQEGEYTFKDLIDYHKGLKDIYEVRGICFNDIHNRKFIKNRSELIDMELLPFPALDTLEDIIQYKGALTLECSRGCNYAKCTFCPRYHKTTCWRCLSPQQTIKHFITMDDVARKNHLESTIFLADEEFIGQLPENNEVRRINELCSYLNASGKNITFELSARVDSIYDPTKSHEDNIKKLDMWRELQKSGLKRLFLGVESGCDRQLKRFAKGTTSEQNAIAIRLVSALGINIRVGYITFDPLMPSFDDLVDNIDFLERNDIILNHVPNIRTEELYYNVIDNGSFLQENALNEPLYTKVSYMLTSLEVLAASRYSKMMENEENKSGKKLLVDIDVNMARYKVAFLNETIGMISECCQKWIDSNFALLYTIKSLHKVARTTEKEHLYKYMVESRKISHYFLKYILHVLEIHDYSKSLIDFFTKRGRTFESQKGAVAEVLVNSLNLWHGFMETLVRHILDDMKCDNISDTFDGSLQNSIDRWFASSTDWKLIN